MIKTVISNIFDTNIVENYSGTTTYRKLEEYHQNHQLALYKKEN